MERISRADERAARPCFDVPVPDDGYRWWYIDGLSADGREGIVVIAFIGSVFSPYYFAARQSGATDPRQHVAVNVGLYQRRGKRWAMTERNAGALEQSLDTLSIGPSSLTWQNDALTIRIDERSAPFNTRIRGTVTLRPRLQNRQEFALDSDGRHRWQPLAPDASITVRLDQPSWRWSGQAYMDTNAGSRPLEADFRGWTWSRRHAGEHTEVVYAVDPLSGNSRALAIDLLDDAVNDLAVPPRQDLPHGAIWRVKRPAHSDMALSVDRTLEDTPFYTRSILQDGTSVPIMHESLDLQRFRAAWVRRLLPFRMPRRASPNGR